MVEFFAFSVSVLWIFQCILFQKKRWHHCYQFNRNELILENSTCLPAGMDLISCIPDGNLLTTGVLLKMVLQNASHFFPQNAKNSPPPKGFSIFVCLVAIITLVLKVFSLDFFCLSCGPGKKHSLTPSPPSPFPVSLLPPFLPSFLLH